MARLISTSAQKSTAHLAAAPAPSTPATNSDAASATSGETAGKATKVRRPFGQHRQKLAYAEREGFHRHWFNDEPGRIDDAKAAGYEHVEEKGKTVSRPVGTAPNGAPLTAFLMELPQELYEADMAAQQAIVDETDRAIRQGTVQAEVGDGRYIPNRGIKIREEIRRG